MTKRAGTILMIVLLLLVAVISVSAQECTGKETEAAQVTKAAQPTEGTMKITFETTGGLVGITTTKTFDTINLSADQANNLSKLVNLSNFFNLPTSIAYSGPARDFFHYNISIESNGKKHSVNVDEPAAPPKLKPLIQMLKSIKP
jgi:hypothetical protein